MAAAWSAIILPVAAVAAPLTNQPGGLVSAPVTINGKQSFEFILDTAASQTVIAPSLVKQLSLKPFPEAAEPLNGATGTVSADVFALTRLEMDGMRKGLVRAISHRGLPVTGSAQGILGADFFANYAVEFDFPANQVRLSDPAQMIPTDGWAVEPLTFNRRAFPLLQGKLDGIPITILVDTGAQVTVLNGAAAKLLSGSHSQATQHQQTPHQQTPHQQAATHSAPQVHGATGHAVAIKFRDFTSLSGANVSFSPNRIAVGDLPVFRTLGLDQTPAMIMGIDKLRGSRIIFDYPRSRLLIRSAATGSN